jgi:hypothetical protein
MEYIYENITISPNLATNDIDGVLISGIHYDVENSSMTDKSLEWCRWDEIDGKLYVVFTNELSSGDKTILDGIIVDNS